MVKELLLAVLAFAVTALVIIILMTAVGNTLFPSAVSIVENRLEEIQPAETAPPSPVSPPEPAPSDAPEPVADVPSGDGGLPEDPEAPAADADDTATPTAPPAVESEAGTGESQPLTEDLTDDLAPGGILPLSDGQVAYKVQSGDTFSQICKKVIGTGRQQVWQKAAEMMNIDYRTIRPGRVLIFDAAVLALGEEE